MFIGGCAGSTTGGIKIFRLQILFRGAITQIRKLTQPHAILVMRFNGKTVNENTYNSIMGFFFMYIFLFGRWGKMDIINYYDYWKTRNFYSISFIIYKFLEKLKTQIIFHIN